MTVTTAIPMGKRYQVNVILDPDQIEAIDAMAALRRTSRAAVLREAVDTYLAVHRIPRIVAAQAEDAAP